MTKERKAQIVTIRACASQSSTQSHDDVTAVFYRQVGEFVPVDIAPNKLDRIKLRSISWEPLDLEPVSLQSEIFPHRHAAMCIETIPYQDDALAAEMSLEDAQKANQGF